jgi:hypothetical protein
VAGARHHRGQDPAAVADGSALFEFAITTMLDMLGMAA